MSEASRARVGGARTDRAALLPACRPRFRPRARFTFTQYARVCLAASVVLEHRQQRGGANPTPSGRRHATTVRMRNERRRGEILTFPDTAHSHYSQGLSLWSLNIVGGEILTFPDTLTPRSRLTHLLPPLSLHRLSIRLRRGRSTTSTESVAPGGYSIVASEVILSQRTGTVPCRLLREC